MFTAIGSKKHLPLPFRTGNIPPRSPKASLIQSLLGQIGQSLLDLRVIHRLQHQNNFTPKGSKSTWTWVEEEKGSTYFHFSHPPGMRGSISACIMVSSLVFLSSVQSAFQSRSATFKGMSFSISPLSAASCRAHIIRICYINPEPT